MKNFRKKLPMIFSLVMIFLLTSCKVDWSTVNAIETNKIAFGLFWFLVQIVVPVLLWLFVTVFGLWSDGSAARSVGNYFLTFGFIGVYVFHFWHLNVDWFNLLCLAEFALCVVTFFFYGLDEDNILGGCINSIASIGIMIVSLLANVYTGRFLEPFVFSCAGWLTIWLGSISSSIRDDVIEIDIVMIILAPILCLAAMIFGVVNVDVPNLLYFISIQCAIIIVLSSFVTHICGFIILILGYAWLFVISNLYNPERFGKSVLMSLVFWGVLAVLVVVVVIVRKKAEEAEAKRKAKANAEAKAKAAAAAKIKAEQEAKARAEAEAKAAEEAKIKAEQEAKARAEAEAKAKIEAENKAKAEAEAKAVKLAEDKVVLEKLEAELASKKAEVAALGMDAQGIIQKGKLNKEVKELESQIENLKSEIEKLK